MNPPSDARAQEDERLQDRQSRRSDQLQDFNQSPRRTARDRAQSERQFDQRRDARFDRDFDERFEPEADQRFRRGSVQPFEGEDRSSQGSSQDRRGPASAQADSRQQIDLGAQFSASQDALTVSSIEEGALAAEIGLRESDEIVSVGGRTVTSADQLNDLLVRSQTFQERIPIVVRRDNRPTTLYIQPQVLRDTFVVSPRPVVSGLGFVTAPLGGDRLIVREVAGGLADVIGLRERDVIVSVAGRSVATQEQFVDVLYSVDVDEVPIIVIRDGRQEVLYVRQDELGVRMVDAPDLYVAENAWLGVVLDTRYPDAAVVRSVVANSPADRAGVREGDRIERVNGRRITSADHLMWLIDSLDPGQEVELDVSRRISGTLVARLEGEQAAPQRQAMRPTYEYYAPAPPDVQVQQRQYYRGEIVDDFDADLNGPGVGRFGPAERGLRDRLDWDERPDEPRGILRRR